MVQIAPTPGTVLSDSPARSRAKERLYVFLQVFCWGMLALLQTVFVRLTNESQHIQERALPASVQALAFGLLLTHFGRHFLNRWGWKDLGWKALAPRMIGFALVQAFIWCVFLFFFQAYILGWLHDRTSWRVLFIGSWINLSIVLIGWLALYFFYHLFDRFNRAEIDRLQLNANVKQDELRALKSQLNPHFIFNSLNSLRALIDEDPQRARQAVTQLANLLRYSLQSGQLELVPFETELKVVKDFLSLEQVRHEERLRFSFEVDPGALQWPVPPMLLQTLVENAVKYGITTRANGGEVAVSVRVRGDVLVLRVSNPGRLVANADGLEASTGLGLRNAAERLRLLLGEESSLQLRESGPDQVVAEAVIPKDALVNA